MNRLKLIINLILGKNIVIYNMWTKEVLMIIGSDEEIMTKRYDYDFIDKDSACLTTNDKTGNIYFDKEAKNENS